MAVGIAADIAPATAFRTSPAMSVGFRPRLSDMSPTKHPPISIPEEEGGKEGRRREKEGKKEGKGGKRRERRSVGYVSMLESTNVSMPHTAPPAHQHTASTQGG